MLRNSNLYVKYVSHIEMKYYGFNDYPLKWCINFLN
jgi:hypothetical protein